MPIKDPEDRAAYHKQYMKNRYDNDPEFKKKHTDRQAIVKQKYRQWFRDIKAQYKCVKCGENHPACLDFHHLRDKEFEVSRGVKANFSKTRILAEIAKCEVLCANCHRKEHYDA